MAHVCDGQGDRRNAVQYYKQSVEIYRQIGDKHAISHPLCDLAWIVWDQGLTLQARTLMEEHLATFRALGMHTIGLGMALEYMRFITMWMGDFDATKRFLQESSIIEPWSHTERSKAGFLSAQGHFYAVSGRLEESRKKLEIALNVARAEKDDRFTLTCFLLDQLGNVLVHQGKLIEGLIMFEECLALIKYVDPSNHYWSLDILTDYASAVFKNNDIALAQSLLHQSLNQVRHTLPKIPHHLEGLAQVARAFGNCDRAVRLLGAAHHMRETMALPIFPIDQEEHARFFASLKEEMSEQAFSQAWNEGSSMLVGELIEYAQMNA